ncbi:MAG: hypothetical protein KJZ70_03115 [Bryobacterales bacterium]|nr:hypothetical protein [Bryobacterales bacterium]
MKVLLESLARSALVRRMFTAGVLLTALSVILGYFSSSSFYRAYLVAYLLWSGVAFGSLIVLCMHHLSGGGWGYLIRRILEAATRTWGLTAVLFLPVILGIPSLYSWADAQALRANPALRDREVYLNPTAFSIRALVFFAVFILLAVMLNRASQRQDSDNDPALLRRLQNVGGPGLLLFVVLLSFALIDWAMSLQPEWYSTVFSAMVIVGFVESALAFAIVVLFFVGDQDPLAEFAVPKYVLDLGNMLFTFLFLWVYMQFSQLLIIWSGNLKEEIPWYLSRLQGNWETVTMLLAALGFAIPFGALLARRGKRDLRSLAKLAAFLFALRLLATIWIVEPAFFPEGYSFQILDLLLPLGIGGIWTAYFVSELQRLPLLPTMDPRLALVRERMGETRVGDITYE